MDLTNIQLTNVKLVGINDPLATEGLDIFVTEGGRTLTIE